jgi:hypothetical protein
MDFSLSYDIIKYMKEKLILSSPEADKIFTPEQLKKMEKEAAENELAEAIREGSYVRYTGPGLEEFGCAEGEVNKTNYHQGKVAKLKPRPNFQRKQEIKGYGWLDTWEKTQDENIKNKIKKY